MPYEIEYDRNFDTMFDYDGVTYVPNGTAPHNPDIARVVIRNGSLVAGHEISPDDLDKLTLCATLNKEAELLELVKSMFVFSDHRIYVQ